MLLYGFSGFGMPVSTTACLVFELVGAALFLAGFDNVNWPKVGYVTTGIVFSIVVSGLASFMVMRVFRGAMRDKAQDRETVLLARPLDRRRHVHLAYLVHGLQGPEERAAGQGAEGGDLRGLRRVAGADGDVGRFHAGHAPGAGVDHRRGYKYLFPVTAVLGMICMAFAFGQNDLANAASPGLAGIHPVAARRRSPPNWPTWPPRFRSRCGPCSVAAS